MPSVPDFPHEQRFDATPLFSSLDPHETNCGGSSSDLQESSDDAESSRRDLLASRPVPPGEDFEDDFFRPTRPVPSPLKGGNMLRHRCWWHDRGRVFAALKTVFPARMRPSQFGECGTFATVQVKPGDFPEYRVISNTCRDRWCRPCAADRARVVAGNIIEKLGTDGARFLTLTIRTDELTLKQAVRKLYVSFSKLRQTTFWKTRVTGGCVVCEVKRSKDRERWHPHLHAIIQGRYVEFERLRKHWFRITGDSYIVHISKCNDATDAARYITEYLSKPVPAHIVRNDYWLIEAIKALHGRRMLTTFGDWRGCKLTETEPDGDWQDYCTYRELVDRARRQDVEAARVLRRLLMQHHLPEDDCDRWVQDTQTLPEPVTPDGQLSLDVDWTTQPE